VEAGGTSGRWKSRYWNMELSCVNLSRIEDGHTDIQLFTLFNIFQGLGKK
jgi:hypothetical protein